MPSPGALPEAVGTSQVGSGYSSPMSVTVNLGGSHLDTLRNRIIIMGPPPGSHFSAPRKGGGLAARISVTQAAMGVCGEEAKVCAVFCLSGSAGEAHGGRQGPEPFTETLPPLCFAAATGRSRPGRMSLHHSPAVRLKGQQWWQQQSEPWRSQVDDSLTNLQWLQEFSILTANPEKPTAVSGERVPQRQASEAPSSPPEGDTACMGKPPRMGKPVSSSTSSLPPLLPTQAPVDYRTNSQVKPPYSYATLICMAMRASKEAKLTLSAIYAWITENFCYYRHADPSWQNSIRHNLSLNKRFQKVPRRKDEPGKGGFWQINPQYSNLFVNGVFQRRRMPALSSTCIHSTQPVPGRGSFYQDTMPRPSRIQRRLGRPKQPLASACPGRATWTGPLSPVAPVDREVAPTLAGDLSWASVLGGTFTGAESNFEDMELTAALDSLAAEDRGPHCSQPALNEDGGLCPAPGLTKELILCTETWGAEEEEEEEERASEPGPGWAFEVGACFSEGFLAGIQPWED
ncbi:hypothetical protein JD844_020155 [Phrynosoma platyrhinos]|uniref:Fork-head domain-containing protein n=1 Tax=Phrynosoma platyrhinos TaxID=52577 RepID=A0ABQ7TS36_PHRPL|nr:hypothetical protein JD844_020155 [Phrynosoma platyrhinos]